MLYHMLVTVVNLLMIGYFLSFIYIEAIYIGSMNHLRVYIFIYLELPIPLTNPIYYVLNQYFHLLMYVWSTSQGRNFNGTFILTRHIYIS